MRWLLFILVLMGCKSSDKKLADLRWERTEQCLLAQRFEETGDTTYQDAPIKCRIAGKRLEDFLASH